MADQLSAPAAGSPKQDESQALQVPGNLKLTIGTKSFASIDDVIHYILQAPECYRYNFQLHFLGQLMPEGYSRKDLNTDAIADFVQYVAEHQDWKHATCGYTDDEALKPWYAALRILIDSNEELANQKWGLENSEALFEIVRDMWTMAQFRAVLKANVSFETVINTVNHGIYNRAADFTMSYSEQPSLLPDDIQNILSGEHSHSLDVDEAGLRSHNVRIGKGGILTHRCGSVFSFTGCSRAVIKAKIDLMHYVKFTPDLPIDLCASLIETIAVHLGYHGASCTCEFP